MTNTDPSTPAVLRLSDLAAYEDGFVASRLLLKNESGSVTVFAFAAGERMREHATRFDALIVVTDGEAEVSMQGETHRVGAGETLHLPPGVPHAVHAARAFRMLLVTLHPPRYDEA